MRSRWLASIALTIGVCMTAGPLSAHHGTASYDNTQPVTVTGVITDFKFVNPHVLIYWEAKDDKGNVEHWIGERSGPNSMARNAGWSSKTLKPGDQVTISGRRAKNGTPNMAISKILLNGKELSLGAGEN